MKTIFLLLASILLFTSCEPTIKIATTKAAITVIAKSNYALNLVDANGHKWVLKDISDTSMVAVTHMKMNVKEGKPAPAAWVIRGKDAGSCVVRFKSVDEKDPKEKALAIHEVSVNIKMLRKDKINKDVAPGAPASDKPTAEE